jgi:hypothetical protein
MTELRVSDMLIQYTREVAVDAEEWAKTASATELIHYSIVWLVFAGLLPVVDVNGSVVS